MHRVTERRVGAVSPTIPPAVEPGHELQHPVVSHVPVGVDKLRDPMSSPRSPNKRLAPRMTNPMRRREADSVLESQVYSSRVSHVTTDRPRTTF